jgi:hypothetical protein
MFGGQQAPGLVKSGTRWQPKVGAVHLGGRLSGAQALTALGAAAGQDLTAAFGGHAGAETVGTLALEYAGLECSLHDICP